MRLVKEHQHPSVPIDAEGSLVGLGLDCRGGGVFLIIGELCLTGEGGPQPLRRRLQQGLELVRSVQTGQSPPGELPGIDHAAAVHRQPGESRASGPVVQLAVQAAPIHGEGENAGEAVPHGQGRKRISGADVRHGDGGGGIAARHGALAAQTVPQQQEASRPQSQDQYGRRGSLEPGTAAPDQYVLLRLGQQVLSHVVQTLQQFFRFHSKPSSFK